VGTLGSLYKDVPRHLVLADLLFACNSFPALTVQEALRGKGTDIAAAVAGT
jgi:hypothetical protein